MREPIPKILLLVMGVVIILGAGCRSAGRLAAQQELPSVKKSRVIAAENIQLKKELKRREQEIDKLKKLHEKQIKQKEKLLTRCLKRKEALEKQLQEGVKEQVNDVLAVVMEENAKLRGEIKNLKAQIAKLKKEIEESKAKPRLSKKPQPL